MWTVVITSLPATIGKTTGAGTYFNGDSVKVTALPDSGYTFTGWTESGTTVSTSLSYIFTISANRILVANYSQIQYTVAVVSNPANAGSVSGGGTFTFGTSVILKAKPNDTYSFVNWTLADSVVSTSASFSLKVKRNWNLTANFVKTPVLTVTPDFVDAGSSAGTAVITITNTGGGTINWSVTADVFWVTIKSGTSGVNNGTINLSYMPNNSIARIGTITITAPGIAGSPIIIEVRQSSSATSVEDLNLGIPVTYVLNQNYPNPFNPSTKIRFGLPKESNVRLSIFNILGQEVARPVQSVLSAGYHEVNFNANIFPSGIYIYRISAGSFNEIKKMLLIK